MCKKLIYFISFVLVLGMAADVANAQATVTDGLVGYWPLDEGAGDTAYDMSGMGHDGTLYNGVTWISQGFKKGGINNDGSPGSRVDLGTWNPAEGTGQLSLAIWFKWSGAGPSRWQGLIGKRNGWSGATAMMFYFELDRDNDAFHFARNGSWVISPAGSVTEVIGEWAHAAVSFDGTTGTIYLNGEAIQAGPFSFLEGTATSMGIGHSHGGSNTNAEAIDGDIDEVYIYNRALSQVEIKAVMTGLRGQSSSPNPADEAIDVLKDVTLDWTAGEFADKHDVYFGTNFDDVNDATTTVDPNNVYKDRQDPNRYPISETLNLDFGRSYYWRVDEVNAPPSSTIIKGDVWSFTVEPFSYPIDGNNITATASSSSSIAQGPENTVNGSGLDNDLHSTEATDMWLSDIVGPQPTWIQYEFDKAYELYELWVWNHNTLSEAAIGYGIKEATIEYSDDGASWTTLGTTHEFIQAPGADGYEQNTTVDLGGITAKYVRLTANSKWGSVLEQYGLSEVRFSYVPALARKEQPANETTGVENTDVVLGWFAGRGSDAHQIYLSTDEQAVAGNDAGALIDTIARDRSITSYMAGTLDLGSMYYWKINEVQDPNGANVVRDGNLWSFATKEFAVVEDFESYNEDDNLIYVSWLDGMGYRVPEPGYAGNGTGSIVGDPYGSTTARAGSQSMPMLYDNTSVAVSETQRTWDTPMDWTVNGITNLGISYRGAPQQIVENPDGTTTMSSYGTSTWSDHFSFYYKKLKGNGSMTMRLDSMTQFNTDMRIGLMIRETLDRPSAYNFSCFRPNTTDPERQGNCRSYRRLVTGGAASQDNQVNAVTPVWLRITRDANSLRTEASQDGLVWDKLDDNQDIPMVEDVYIGVSLASYSGSRPVFITYEITEATGDITGDWEMAIIGNPQPIPNEPDQLYVVVTDSDGASAVVKSDNPDALLEWSWQDWLIPIDSLTPDINVASVESIVVGIGDPDAAPSGATGEVFIDEIKVGNPID